MQNREVMSEGTELPAIIVQRFGLFGNGQFTAKCRIAAYILCKA